MPAFQMVPCTILDLIYILFGIHSLFVAGLCFEFDWYLFLLNVYWIVVMVKMMCFTLNAGATTTQEVEKISRKVHQIIRSVRDQELIRVVFFLLFFNFLNIKIKF